MEQKPELSDLVWDIYSIFIEQHTPTLVAVCAMAQLTYVLITKNDFAPLDNRKKN